MPAGTARLVLGLRGRLPERRAERFRTRPAVVVPGQDLAIYTVVHTTAGAGGLSQAIRGEACTIVHSVTSTWVILRVDLSLCTIVQAVL